MVMLRMTVSGEEQVDRRLLSLTLKGADMSEMDEQLHKYLLGVERRQFDTEGRSGSGGWKPLKPATVRRKAAQGRDTRILRATEALRRSLTNKTDAQHIFHREGNASVGSVQWWFGTSDPKAVIHQKGAPRANVPQRKPIDMSSRNRSEIGKIFQRILINNSGRA